MSAAWYRNTDTLYKEYMQRLANIDAAYKLGMYDSKEDADWHKDRVDAWFNDMHTIMAGYRAAA